MDGLRYYTAGLGGKPALLYVWIVVGIRTVKPSVLGRHTYAKHNTEGLISALVPSLE
jgi:hypothetical protein